MKRTALLCLLLVCLCAPLAGARAATTFVPFELANAGLTVAFPEGWTVVTPDTTAKNLKWFAETDAEIAANNMLSEGVEAIAFAPEGGRMLRVLARADADSALYYDIDRYSTEMRAAIRADFLDKEAWSLTGYRFSSAEWTNKAEQRRILWLSYTLRYGEETVARGLQAFTVRGAKRYTLDFRTEGKVSEADQALFRAFVGQTVFPEAQSEKMPLLPVGLTTSAPLPEETNKQTAVIRGSTSKNAVVTAVLTDALDKRTDAGSAAADASGNFKLTLTLPGEGEWQLLLTASKEGMADSALTGWISCDYDRLPVNFSAYPSGDVYDAQPMLSGKTLANVKIQCIEGESNKSAYTDSDGNFSFKLDRGITGARSVVLAMSKKGYGERRFVVEFNRCWEDGDYAKYLEGKVESLSYANLSGKGEQYAGRVIRYEATVVAVSSSELRRYVQLAKDGDESMQFVAVREGEDVALAVGDEVTVYCEVTGESFDFSSLTAEGDEVNVRVPSVKLLHCLKKF